LNTGTILSNQVDKNTFIETILYGRSSTELSTFNTKTESFSDIAIDNFIKRISIWHYWSVIRDLQKIKNSSGERKKIYLDYCIKQNPEYIIVDNPLDHLDQESRKNNHNYLQQLAKKRSWFW
jgi:molybdate transport system ATP-binding protein